MKTLINHIKIDTWYVRAIKLEAGVFSIKAYEREDPTLSGEYSYPMPAGLNWRFWTGLMYGTAYLDNFEELGAFQAGPSDVEAPVFDSVSVNIAANATSWAGADVSYTLPGAIDNIDPSPQVSCSPASGSTFAVGVNQVTCTATDLSGKQ